LGAAECEAVLCRSILGGWNRIPQRASRTLLLKLVCARDSSGIRCGLLQASVVAQHAHVNGQTSEAQQTYKG
jgi:hypothetical protein